MTMRLDVNNLPNDPVLLQKLVRDLTDHLQEKDSRIDKLEHQLAVLRRARFGRSSEKLNPNQLAFWKCEHEADIAQTEQALANVKDQDTAVSKKGKTPKRQPLPAHLPRQTQEHTLMSCQQCGGELTAIGTETVEQLDYRPASFYVRQHIKHKYACTCCQTAVTAPMPAQPIEKGLPGPGVLAQVITAKFCDHLPVYRQSEIYKRQDISLSPSTLNGWLGATAFWAEILVERLTASLIKDGILHTDDIPVPVLAPGNGKTKTGRLWVYLRDKRFDQPCAVFDYTPSRNKDGPLKWLGEFEGFLQADEYPGYESLYRDGRVIPVSCWYHARRKFVEIEERASSPIAREAIRRIAALSAIESRLDDENADWDRRLEVRQAESVPQLESMKTWLDNALLGVSRKSALAVAISYLTKRWSRFTCYTTDGRLLMHNNPSENANRLVALGRKNYLFAGSDMGGRRAAAFYSLIVTCKLNGIDPFAYLADVLARLPTHPHHRIDELLPYNWQPN